MASSKPELVARFFDAASRGDLRGAVELTTADVVIDRTNSAAPWRGRDAGHEGVRTAIREVRESVDELEWRVLASRELGPELVAVDTVISMRGRASGLAADARGGWVIGFRGDLIADGKLYQSFDEALLAARRRRLAAARLYLVCEGLPNGREPTELLAAAIRGGVDVIQLREKAARCDEELIALADPFARAAREHGALFFLNDRPDLVEACGADGVHVGQDDEPVAVARATAGPAALVGLSSHSPAQFDAAVAATGAARPDQLSAGPVWETPTKRGRPAAGLALIEHAAGVTAAPAWFAIGGIDRTNIDEVVAAGAGRVVVVRAIRDAADPEAAARELRGRLA